MFDNFEARATDSDKQTTTRVFRGPDGIITLTFQRDPRPNVDMKAARMR
jgi:hypothetical protein